MAGRVKEAIIPHVRTLITQLTNFHEGEENFELCERFVLSNLWHHRFLSVDSHAVCRSVDGIIMKFEVHGHLDTSVKLRQLIDKFLNQEVFNDHPQYDIQWSLLSVLLNLAVNPTATAHHLKSALLPVEESCVEDGFDWTSYLREGDEKFICSYDDTSSEDLDSDSDDQSNDVPNAHIIRMAASLPAIPNETEPLQGSKENLIKNLKDIYLAEDWLDSNIQQTWALSLDQSESTISRFPSANLANYWNQYLKDQDNSSDYHVNILSEYKILRQILFMFYTTSSTQLFEESNKKISVKPGFTIPSLTKECLTSFLNDLCPYFEMLKEFRSFGEDLNKSCNQPPNTYIAYWNEVKEFLRDFNDFLISIERKVKKQDGIYTLLKLKNDLQPKLAELRCIYSLHARAIYDWKTSSNWLSATCLLSVLYGEISCESKNTHAAIILKLFLKSFEVYLNIVDTWLTDGKLVDSREEFVIDRNGEVRPYERMLNNAGIEPLPVLKLIIKKVVPAVSSIDLLLRLIKLPHLNKIQGCMFEELVKSVKEDFQTFSKTSDLEKFDKSVDDREEERRNNKKNHFFSEVKNHVLHFADPFLLQAFENYFPLKDKKMDDSATCPSTRELNIRIQEYTGQEMLLPIKPVIERNLAKLVDNKCKTACCMVKPIFQDDFNLTKHFQVIRGIFLMEAGDVMHQFYSSLFQQIQLCEASSFSLSIHLRSCVDLIYPDFSSYFLVVVDKNLQNATSVQEAINSIKLKYSVDWPMSLILTEQNMDLYNAVFQFLLKIKWAIYSLQKLRFTDLKHDQLKKSEKRRAQRLHILRFWLLHSVNSIHNYLMGQVLHSLGVELQHNVEEAYNLDSLVEAHGTYVQMVYVHCLQTQEHELVRKPILRMISTALRLCEAWGAGAIALSDARLSELEDLYCRCYVFLSVVLSNCVERDTVSQLKSLYAVFDVDLLYQNYRITID
ncbi:hypothetical protein C0J52_15095 [Blattella germanica]|nr:hypothetical protein C0J52_15095 [Blattella germanica]